jgi:hypothetical protein
MQIESEATNSQRELTVALRKSSAKLKCILGREIKRNRLILLNIIINNRFEIIRKRLKANIPIIFLLSRRKLKKHLDSIHISICLNR